MTPPSPWMGSMSTATVLGVMAASTAAASPYSMTEKPGVKGPKSLRAWQLVEKLTTEIVRPWKLFLKQMISALSGSTPLTV